MHGGLPFIGISMLVYGAVGAGVLLRGAVARSVPLAGRRAHAATPPVRRGRHARRGRGAVCPE